MTAAVLSLRSYCESEEEQDVHPSIFRQETNVRNGSMLLKKSAFDRSGRWGVRGRAALCHSGGHRLRWHRDELGQLAQVLGGGCEVELVAGAVGAS